MQPKRQTSRYHPALVALHWLAALLIIGMLLVGFFWLAPMANENPQKLDILRVHMALGVFILFLMIGRFIVRMRTARPPDATTGYRFLDRLAPLTHYLLYLLVIAMVMTGYTTGLLAGLPDIVFAGSGDPLPETLLTYPTFVAHVFLAFALSAFVGLHILAALYHQFVKKDGLFRRMGFGRRTVSSTADNA